MINLNNKKILVMGASGFIGEKTAITLSKLGAKVILSGRNINKLEEILPKLFGKGHNLITFDVEENNKTMNLMKSIIEMDGEKLSGLVYCTGAYPLRPLKSISYEYLDQMMKINFYGFIEMVKCFSHKKICDGGSIVAISSYAAINGDKGQVAYSAAKGALDASIKSMSKELYSKKIRINTIRPAGLLKDNINFQDLPQGIQNSFNEMKTGPICPNRLAEQIAFLLSDYSSGVYGRSFDVRGYLS